MDVWVLHQEVVELMVVGIEEGWEDDDEVVQALAYPAHPYHHTPLLPGGVGIVAIIGVTINAATKDVVATNAAATTDTAADLVPGNLSLLKRLHLQFLCGVILDIDTPAIWMEVRAALTKHAALIVLIHHLMVGMESCRHLFFGHVDLFYYTTNVNSVHIPAVFWHFICRKVCR